MPHPAAFNPHRPSPVSAPCHILHVQLEVHNLSRISYLYLSFYLEDLSWFM